MVRVDIHEAKKLVQSIRDGSNPQVSSTALEVGDKWLIENDFGVLEMTAEVRATLEAALDGP